MKKILLPGNIISWHRRLRRTLVRLILYCAMSAFCGSHTCTAQWYISPQAGYSGTKSLLVAVSGGLDYKFLAAEGELKFATSRNANSPAFMGMGAGPRIVIKDCWQLQALPQGYYMYISADHTEMNGWRMGACLRMQYKQVTLAYSIANNTSFITAGVKLYFE
ncbi:MAG TPA: hypothetical protein PL045_03710 [Chitinophagaceae bacterium]|nr:hypothetical protein [Chitinophagaceae bacterium]